MPQVSVIPANTRPAPTNAESQISGWNQHEPIAPNNTSDPAAMRTCRSREMAFLPRTTGKPAATQAVVPPSTLMIFVKPALTSFSQACRLRPPDLHITYSGSPVDPLRARSGLWDRAGPREHCGQAPDGPRGTRPACERRSVRSSGLPVYVPPGWQVKCRQSSSFFSLIVWFFRPLAAEARLDAGEDAGQMHFDDPVIGLAAFFLVVQEAAPLHEPQMFGCHVAGYAAGLGQLADRVAVAQQHLDHPQPMGMGQGLQAFGRLLQGAKRRQCGQFFGV